MEVAILIILYLAGFLGVFFCFYQLAGLLDKLTYQDQAVGSIKVWILKKLFYHHGPTICCTNLNKSAHYQCMPPHFAGCNDMFQLLSNSSYIDPPPKWKRERAETIQLKTTCSFRPSCPIRMTRRGTIGLLGKTRCGLRIAQISFQMVPH